MKRIIGLLFILLFVLSACGRENKTKTNEEYLVLERQKEECLLFGDDLQGYLLSSQYHEGEILQFWSVTEENENGRRLNIYLCRQGAERELLFENVATSFGGQWFLDNEGNYYILKGKEIVKVDGSGTLFFRQEVSSGSLKDICQLPDGRIYLLQYTDEADMKLLSMEPATGETAVVDRVVMGEGTDQSIAAGEDGLLLLNAEGIWSVDTGSGAKTNLMRFEEYDYAPAFGGLSDFRLVGENAAEILYSGEMETLRVTNLGESRTIITVRCRNFWNELFMKECIVLFNQSNDTYYVVADTVKEGEDSAAFQTKTDLEIGTGGGPDIVFRDAVTQPESLLEKGAFVDLRPYMEASGMKEEDYFSAAFDFWKVGDGIYAANMVARPNGEWISEELLGSLEAPDIETLIDAMLRREEKTVFQWAWESDQVLEYFLVGSENLWGMVDWEKGTCDFSGDLFAKMLEAAKRYGYDRTENHPSVAEPMSVGLYSYETRAQMESEGKVPVGYIFEDGCYPIVNHTGVMAINSNSDDAHRQGAWEFMAFLLSEEVQTEIGQFPYPVSRKVFEAIAKREMEEGSITVTIKADGRSVRSVKGNADVLKELNYDEEAFRAIYDLTEEKVDEIRTLLETSRALPTRVVPLITMINEDASAYFIGSKSIEEVVPVIQNRVQLYLNENRK